MYWLIDESSKFMFDETPKMEWKIAAVTGALLPNQSRSKWLLKYSNVPKGSELTKKCLDSGNEKIICDILDDMYRLNIQGILIAGDIGHTSKQDAEIYREEWINPHYFHAGLQPEQMNQSIISHLDNLKGVSKSKLSLQDFFKTLCILETIVNQLRLFLTYLNKHTSGDVRRNKLIIDDQCKAAVRSLKHFVYYFLHQRSQDQRFLSPHNTKRRLRNHLTQTDPKAPINLMSLLDQILVEDGAKMDDLHKELKIADLLSNFSWNALNGSFSIEVVKKLDKVIKVTESFCFNPREDVTVNLPLKTQEAVNILLKKPKPWLAPIIFSNGTEVAQQMA